MLKEMRPPDSKEEMRLIGGIGLSSLVPIDTSAGEPAEQCWLSSPDERPVFTTKLGDSNISRFHSHGAGLTPVNDPACPKVPRHGSLRALSGDISDGLSVNGITPDGAYFYQVCGNTSKLVGYATQPDGSPTEISSLRIPYNGLQGLGGF